MSIRRSMTVLLVAVLAAAAAPATAQTTVELAATMDGTLYEDPAGTIANGAGMYIFVGTTAQPLDRRALVAFDVAGEIPAGATILSAELILQASRVASADEQAITLHAVTESWGEGTSDAPGQEGAGTAAAPGDATWLHRMAPGTLWAQEGGSFVPGASAMLAVGGLGSYSWGSTPDMVNDVQGWLDDPSSNFGWLLLMSDGVSGSAKRFNSRENGSSPPVLRVEYMAGGGGGELDVFYLVAAAAKSAGAAGAFFQTDLDIVNGDADQVSYQLLWLPRGSNNASPVTSEVFTLGAGEAVRYRDVLGEVFGFDDDAVGALAVASDSSDLRMMSRTYNLPAAGGTFGQAIPGVRTDRLIRTDQRVRILFFTENADFRSNLGLANGSGEPIRIMWERFSPDGASVDTGMMDLPAWGNAQLNRVFSDLGPVEAAYVDVWTTTPDGLFAAYGSVLDNQTSDPTTVLPQ